MAASSTCNPGGKSVTLTLFSAIQSSFKTFTFPAPLGTESVRTGWVMLQ